MATTQIKVGGRTISLYDVRPYCLYDTETITSGAGTKEVYFFRTPEGKTILDTNLKQFSTIQTGWKFEVAEIRLIPLESASLSDLEAIFGTGQAVLSYLKEGDIEIFTFPAVMFNAGCGLHGCTTATDADIVSLGLPTATAVMKLPVRLIIYGGQTFNFVLKASTGGTNNVKIRCCLLGILQRGVVGA